MYLGINKRVIAPVFLIIFYSMAAGQPGKSHKYVFDSDLQDNNVVSTDHSLLINYSVPELYLENINNDNGTYYKVAIPGHTPGYEPGKPELPVLSRLITIPEGYSYKIKITDVRTSRIKPGKERIEGVLFPAQEGETKEPQKQKPVFRIDKTLYASREFIKSDTVRIEWLGKARQLNLATIYISPVLYNPGSNILEVITSMKIEIIFTPSGDAGTKTLFTESPLFRETFSKAILNYDPGEVIPGYTEKPARMIILTDTAFKKYLEPFIRWKTQKGYKLEILYKGAAFAGNTYTELRDTIKSIYLASTADNPPPEYLLIIGSVAKIPYYGTGNVTDMYYGEFNGNGDYIPEMFIGRLPVADTNELKTIVKKIIQYEKFEFADANKFYNYAVATAGYDDGYANYMNGQIKYAITNYLTTENNIKEYHFYNKQAVGGDSLEKIINKGISFLNYTGHGTTSGWINVPVNVTDTLKNKNMYPFVISNACQTSSFELKDCYANKWVVRDTTNKKGALGCIGGSNDTYWSEDFYWSVGLGTPSADPAYETTGLGAYDRLFHTHGESPADWRITMGQVIHAGNLAVSASTTSRKKYYWEIYNLVGDPSVIPIIGTPGTFNISLPDTLPNNIRSWSFTADPFSYAAISHSDTLWDASHASPSGSVTLDMPGLSEDSCLLVITGQNKIPVIKIIYFSDISGEFVNLTKSGLNDSAENNNGMADFGETINLDLTVSNLGMASAENLYARISSSSGWITINTDSVMIGTLAGGSEIILNDDLSFTISDRVPDMSRATLDLILKDNNEEKLYKIDITAHAPNLDIVNFLLDDGETGNGDDIADQGETIQLVFHVRNEGSSNVSGMFRISSTDTVITVLEPSVKSGNLEYGEITSIPVSVKISEYAGSGATVYLSVILDCDPYFVNKEFSFRVGQIRESFESASFKIFPWLNISKVPWVITATDSYDGVSSARSGAISHNSSTVLSIKSYYTEADSLKFFQKVSSELSYDFLLFKLNDKEIYKKSGDTGWEKKVIAVPAGYNKMEWIYKKDASVTHGTDGAMIDMIDFAGQGSVRYVRRDLVAARIIAPVQKDNISKESVTLKLINAGPDTIRGFNLAYKINNDSPVKQYFQNLLIPFGDSVAVTFNTKADFSRYGIYNMTIYGYGNADDYPLNDTLKTKIEHTTIDEPLLVFPNPFTGELKIIINSDVAGTASFTLYTSTGKKVLDSEKPVNKGVNEITMNGGMLVPSVYYLRIDFPGVSRTVPVIKTKE
ncbi:MAG: C25 family cysteine peptidase [Bacteroidia bacterium]|nr:C25 family cysteine peptidase [Bacteroidia bacterium]